MRVTARIDGQGDDLNDVQQSDNALAVMPSGESGADVPRVLCIFRDMSNSLSPTNKRVVSLSASTTADELMTDVATNCNYAANSFELVLQRVSEGDTITLNDKGSLTLAELGFRCGGNFRNNLIIGDLNGIPPVKTEPVAISKLVFGSTATISSADNASNDTNVENSFSASSSNRVKTGFVGLVNQAMTCYLNSLLQTLFMTPEFRNALYCWEFDGVEDEGVKSIPFQLQKLFLQLQTSQKPAIGTTELTRSFGWDSSEAWQQHDVQELCRVMFDALECKFKNTDQADLINCLYQGKIKDYVKCLKCGHESAREDSFLDIPLVVRPFGASKSYGSIDEALKAFVQPETLEGSNQYFCEKCDKKCNAHKGLKFMSFPYLLTLQLKRFDFDYNTMHRIKLNDRLTFPEILNLNSFLKEETEDYSNDDCDTTDSGSALDDDVSSCPGNSVSTIDVTQDDDEGIDVGDKCLNSQGCGNHFEEASNLKNAEKGPHSYELFSIMVHSGSASGGHYYAYIKSFYDGLWYSFNDQQVSQISYEDIRKTYGGGPNHSYFTSSTNAYMLMYRQIDKERNKQAMLPENFPEHIKALQQSMQEQEERDRAQKELDRSLCKIKLYCYHPIKKRMIDSYLRIHKDSSLADSTSVAHQILLPDGVIPLEQCRLVKYDGANESLICSFEDSEDKTIEELVGGVRSNLQYDLLLETRSADSKFECYKPGGTTVKVSVVHLETENIMPSKTVRGYLTQTVQEFKDYVAKEMEVPVENMRMVLEKGYNDMKLLSSPEKTLKSEGFYLSSKVFIETSGSDDCSKTFVDSQLYQILDRYSHTICIYVTLPKLDKDILERLAMTVKESSSQNNGPSENQQVKLVPMEAENVGLLNDDLGVDSCDSYDLSGQNMHSDQSEDSSLTDSDRTLIGDEISPRNNSPELSGCNHSCVINSLSEMELMSESIHNSSVSNSPQNELCEDDRNLSSPEENASFSKSISGTVNWVYTTVKFSIDQSEAVGDKAAFTEDVKRFFRAWPFTDTDTGDRMLRLYVDKRILLGSLKKELEPYVGVAVDNFKIYRVYSNNQEFECTRLTDNLVSYGDDCKLLVKLGRALRKGEYRVRIYQLLPDESEPCKFLLDWVFCKGMSVLEAKKEIIPEIRDKCDVDIALNRCRLRKKCWRNPGTIFLDSQKFDDDISIYPNWELFVEVLPDAENFTQTSQLAVYVRRWRSSQFKVDPLIEVVLDEATVAELKQKLSEVSDIEESNVEIAKGLGTFPCDMSLLSINSDLEWNPQAATLGAWPLYISDDGHVIYYRDKTEKEKELTEEEKSALTNKESSKLSKLSRSAYSPRKEKALKIYMDSSPSTSTVQQETTSATTATAEENETSASDK